MYTDDDRGRLASPPSWPVYRLNPSVRVRTGDKVPRTGIYLPDVDDSAAQVMVQDYKAWRANVGYDPHTTQCIERRPTTWTLVERIADSGGSIPGADDPQKTGVRLRCEAGQPCPREGWWFTPAKAGSRRLFKQGEVMPAFSTDYGATIWQWDEQQ